MAGYKIWELPQALVLHHSRPRSAWLFYYQIRNRWHFILKNYQLADDRLPHSAAARPRAAAVRRARRERALPDLSARRRRPDRDAAVAAARPRARAAHPAQGRSRSARQRADRRPRRSGVQRARRSRASALRACLGRATGASLTRTRARRDEAARPRARRRTTIRSLGGVETHARQLVQSSARSGFGVEVVTKRVARRRPRGRRSRRCAGAPGRTGRRAERDAANGWRCRRSSRRRSSAARRASTCIVCIDYRGIGVAAIAAGRLLGRPVIVQGETAGVLAGADAHGRRPACRRSRWRSRRAEGAGARDLPACRSRRVHRPRSRTRGAARRRAARSRRTTCRTASTSTRFRPPEPGERARLRGELGWPLDRPIVLFVGRLSVEKGVMDLLEAWRLADRRDATARARRPRHDRAIRGTSAAPARAFVAAHGLGDRVRFEGPAAGSDAASIARPTSSCSRRISRRSDNTAHRGDGERPAGRRVGRRRPRRFSASTATTRSFTSRTRRRRSRARSRSVLDDAGAARRGLRRRRVRPSRAIRAERAARSLRPADRNRRRTAR